MRVLHVSDLHLGRALGDLSREPEQRALVSELIDAAREHDVALTLIAGDVFDAFTPPAWAEDLFFTLLDGLADGGARAVAVIAGNHDSGLRLAAADPLARRLGIVLAGDGDEPLRGFDREGALVKTTPLAAHTMKIEVPRAAAPLVVGLLPFVSEARVPREHSAEAADEVRYAAHLEAAIAARAAVRERGAFHLLAMHQYVTGGVPSESERRLRIGAISDIDASAIPAGFDYVALGHLHKPQEIVGAGSRAFYAGSPIAYSFSEAGQEKRAIVVDLAKRREARIVSVPLKSGRPLETWSVTSLEEARAMAEQRSGRRPIVEVRARFGRRLSPADGEALFGLAGVTVHEVRDEFLPDASPLALLDDARDLGPEALFRDLWTRRHGEPPDDATMRELASAIFEVQRPSQSEGTA